MPDAPKEKNMANKYLKYFIDKDLTLVDSFTVEDELYGYRITAFSGIGSNPSLHISFFATEMQHNALERTIKSVTYNRFSYNFDAFGLTLVFNDAINKLMSRIDEIIGPVFDALKANKVKGANYCPICGEELGDNTTKRKIGFYTVIFHPDCIDAANKRIDEENARFVEQPGNYGMGTLGAIIGGIAGLAVFIVLYLIGVIGALSAFVSVFVGEKMYKKFGGKQNIWMVVILSVTTVVFMLGGMFGTALIESGKIAADAGVSMSNMEAFRIIMTTEEGKEWFTFNMSMTALFTIVGITGEITRWAKMLKRPEKIK